MRPSATPVWRSPSLALAIAASFAAFAPAPTVASDDPYHAAWSAVAFDWGPLERRFANDACARDRDRFEACLLALAAIGTGHDPPQRPHPGPAGKIVMAGAAPTSGRTFSLETRALRERAVLDDWAGVATGPLDFVATLGALQNAIDPSRHASLAARGTAAYLRRAVDPHTAIAPYDAVDAAYNHSSHGRPIDAFLRGSRRRARPVKAELVATRGRSVVHLRLDHLDDVACFEVSSALSTLIERGATAVLLDLRGNLGGVSREAACIADLFLPRGAPIVRMEALVDDFEARELRAESPVIVEEPIVVLIDSWSASGAEVIAAALQAHERGVIVGERSFGKGTYQDASPWGEHPDVVFYRTVARLVVPPDAEFQVHGVLPDLEAGPRSDRDPDAVVYREENAYPNPIPPRYPPVPQRESNALRTCVRAVPGELGEDPAFATGLRALWCLLSGSLPEP